ncbi:MAG TPA: zinc ribbon domain-containing protein [Candidatus Angelobacter sp.]|nr:zinc ribbon domain-containing protein [Candidatus Angelobacter sp.]
MSRFSDDVRIIPAIAWIIAVVFGAGMFCLLFFVAIPHGHNVKHWPFAAQIAYSSIGVLLAGWVLLIGYINADARRRGMRYVMWTLLAIFIPNSIGIILYFIFRDPLLAQCPKCGAQGRATFTFCPQCGAGLAKSCPSCKRAVEAGWSRCAYCGSALSGGSVDTSH